MGGGHERAGPARRRPPRRRDLLRLQRLHAGRGPAGRAVARPMSSTRGPTTRSGSARTAPPTSPSSSWPPCGPCPACGSSARPTPTRRPTPGASPSTPTGPTALILTRQNDPGPGRDGRRRRRGVPGAATCWSRGRRSARGRADRHGERGPALRGRRPPCWPDRRRRRCGPGWCRCRRGSCSPRRTRPTGTRSCPPASPRLAVEAAASFGWERYADDSVPSTTSAPRPPAVRSWPTSGTPPRTWLPGPERLLGAAARLTIRTIARRSGPSPSRRKDDHDDAATICTTSRARARGSTTSAATICRGQAPGLVTRASGA